MHAPAPLSLRHYGASPGSHQHDHYQVLWGWQGVLELEIEGRGSRISSGRIAVIGPGQRHDFQAAPTPAGSARCFVFDGQDAALEARAGRLFDAPPTLWPLLQFLASQPVGDDELWRRAAPVLLHALPAPGPTGVPPRGRRIDWPALAAWVDSRLHQPLSVAELAAQVHLAPAQFAARCQAQWGRPPMGWVRERRLAAARRLRDQGWAVGEVAARCGYRSPSALTAALRRAG